MNYSEIAEILKGHLNWLDGVEHTYAFKQVKEAMVSAIKEIQNMGDRPSQQPGMEEAQRWVPVDSEEQPELLESYWILIGDCLTPFMGIKYTKGWTAFFKDGEYPVGEDRPVKYWKRIELPQPPKPVQ